MPRSLVLICALLLTAAEAFAQGPAGLLKIPVSPPDQTLHYGSDPLQFGELRLPKTKGPTPVVIIVHGGCWADHFADAPPAITTYKLLKPLAAALTSSGVATWNIEYRRAGSPGGTWPATYTDISAAVDYLRKIAPMYKLDLSNVTIIGHSSGGQLALWTGARAKLQRTSELYSAKPLTIKGIIDIDGPPELAPAQPLESQYCPMPAVTQFVGGTPTEKPDRYREGSAEAYLPLGIPQTIVSAGLMNSTGSLATDYKTAATAKGDTVTVISLEGSHFDLLDPSSQPGKALLTTILAATGPKN